MIILLLFGYSQPMKIGFLVNPIAGMGGSVALKGTDGQATLTEAESRGAERVSPQRAVRAMLGLVGRLDLELITCSGDMGRAELNDAGLKSSVAYESSTPSTREDTMNALRAFVKAGAALVIFAGGDGTAGDVLEAIDQKVPIIGIPTGVKMHSGVFVKAPEDLPLLLAEFSSTGSTKEAEVMDVDEEGVRAGILKARLLGVVRVPDDSAHLQAGKQEYHSGGADEEAVEIGQYVADGMEPDVAYILGPGTTTKRVAEAMGQEKTLLGVDVYVNKLLVLRDAMERDLLDILRSYKSAKIVVTPVGAQGFFFGRGNQQLSARVIRAVGAQNVLVLAGPTKLKGTPVLHADTGDPELDKSFKGRIKVVTGYRRRRMIPVL